ncbi:DUF4815 domain-containing protein [Diaphorobacter sp.]|uniref:DUF4815 domain-containing protein n=1 Tax=Diaphorobacter sp. TaxID=1934310 RepID=UPI0025868FA9|nr:DUF4815 domain-containing protein [Diaphorobacter sp.]
MDNNIHQRFDPAKNHEAILFRQDKVLQSAELNDVQAMAAHRLRGIADALFRDGDVVRDARLIVNSDTGAVQAESGAIYLQGAVRGVPTGALVVPTVGVVNVGIYLSTYTVTELEDPSLLNPATGTPAYQEPGAARKVVQPAWGFAGDGQPGEFFPVWVIEDGYVRAKEAPPNLDAITRAIARYDVDSAGGTYIVSGLRTAMAADLPSGEQVYTVEAGRARVAGFPFELQAGRRLVSATAADLLRIDSEPHLSATADAQRIDIDRPPCLGVPQVRITARRTVNIVRGGFGGGADPLPDASVIQIEEVKQSTTTFTNVVDYTLTAGQVNWAPAGDEPAPGSNYQVTYLYVAVVAPADADATGFTVEGAISGSMVLVTYDQQLPRIDRLCLTSSGTFEWLRGVASAWAPTAPVVPDDMLAIASVYQTWDARRRVVNDGVVMMPMQKHAGERARLDSVVMDLAELRLTMSAQGMDSGIKKGLFADPFLSDAQRDAGLAQTAAIVRGALQLPMVPTVHQLGTDVTARMAPAHEYRVALSQTLRTGPMKVNPYMAFDPLPATVTLVPGVDRWTEVETSWASPITERLDVGSGVETILASSTTSTRMLSEESTLIEHLRQIEVMFTLAGWGPGEPLASVTFDGITVDASPLDGGTLVGSPAGVLTGKFTIPEKVTAGTKAVIFTGTLGSKGSQTFVGQGTAVLRTNQSVRTDTWVSGNGSGWGSSGSSGSGPIFGPPGAGQSGTQNQSQCIPALSLIGLYDPLAQTFTLDEACMMAGVDLWFEAKDSPVFVQVRETSNGLPTSTVLIEQRVAPQDIVLDGPTRVTWVPVQLLALREYCLVVGCDDATTAVSIAELGKQDATAGYVTSQPFQVGVLLSSSNASTWTPHQDRDLTFRLLAAQFSETERVIDLGTADLVDATDLMILGAAERPSPAANCTFEIEFPPALDSAVARLTDGQVVWLAAPFTGQLKVRARITGDAKAAAVLQPGVQLIAAKLQPEADYITRTVAASDDCRVVVVYEGDIPGGSSVQVHVQAAAAGSPWVLVPYLSASTNTAGVREITHQLAGFNAGAACRVRLTLAGSTTARPRVSNLRVVVL